MQLLKFRVLDGHNYHNVDMSPSKDLGQVSLVGVGISCVVGDGTKGESDTEMQRPTRETEKRVFVCLEA